MSKKRKRRLKKSVKISLVIILVFILIISIWSIEYHHGLSAVNKKGKQIEITIEAGDSYSSLGTVLKEKKLIRSTLFYKIYVKTHNFDSLEPGTYELSQKMNVKNILDTLSNKKKVIESVTFREGLNMRSLSEIIEDKLSIKKEDFLATASNRTYLDEWIKKYWFLTEDIKDSAIYYPLEGYLFPDTYHFEKGVDAKDVIEQMLANTNNKLSDYKKEINSSTYSIHEILTVASMVELEAVSTSDREKVARVFYNRLDNNMSLGSDVTTYYGAKVNVGERDLYQTEILDENAYNTRSASMAGKLPVGPICNPSLSAIKGSIDPSPNNYLYFVADKNGKVYFNTNDSGHQKTIAELKKQGLWLEW
jgi:UPF0755 protein